MKFFTQKNFKNEFKKLQKTSKKYEIFGNENSNIIKMWILARKFKYQRNGNFGHKNSNVLKIWILAHKMKMRHFWDIFKQCKVIFIRVQTSKP